MKKAFIIVMSLLLLSCSNEIPENIIPDKLTDISPDISKSTITKIDSTFWIITIRNSGTANKQITLKTIGLNDSVFNIEFTRYHTAKLKDYPTSWTFLASDSTNWVDHKYLPNSINSCWWKQNNDSTLLFNVAFDYLNPYKNINFNGNIRKDSLFGSCKCSINSTNYFNFKFTGTKLK